MGRGKKRNNRVTKHKPPNKKIKITFPPPDLSPPPNPDSSLGNIDNMMKSMIPFLFSFSMPPPNIQEGPSLPLSPPPRPKTKKEVLEEKIDKAPFKKSLKKLLKGKLTGELDKKLNDWFNYLFKIPFRKFKGLDNEHKTVGELRSELTPFLNNAIKILDESVYGLEGVKMEIVSYISNSFTSSVKPRVLALQGSPGIGKTEIVRSGVAKALDKKLACISAGGLKDAAYLNGHNYTYVGSKCGKIVDCLIECGQMDCIIFIDEIDKISEGEDGREIESLLIHILDPGQNSDYRDKYFTEIPIDLSKVFFIVAFNDPKRVSPILLDRLHVIKVEDPTLENKIEISKRYLVPKILKCYKFLTELSSDEVKSEPLLRSEPKFGKLPDVRKADSLEVASERSASPIFEIVDVTNEDVDIDLDRIVEVVDEKTGEISCGVEVSNKVGVEMPTNVKKVDGLVFSDDVVKYIAENYTDEKGIRTLNRCLGTLISRINLYVVLGKSEFKLGDKTLVLPGEKSNVITLPIHVTRKMVDNILDKKSSDRTSFEFMYM
jgi:ATP-dependent Lon protease